MPFSKKSQKFMNYFLSDIDDYLQKLNKHQQRYQDMILGKIYKDIYNSDVFISSLTHRGGITRKKIMIYKSENIPKSTLMDSKYVPHNIKKHINIYSKMYLHYSCTIFSRKVNIYIILFKNDDEAQLKYCNEMVKQMLMWLRMAFLYSPAYCGKNIKILIFLTPFKKILPVSTTNILSTKHCNSAVTTSCAKNGEIVIFRREEWFKVFIHETFHALGLDFSAFSCEHLHYKIKKIFPIQSEINIYEAYTEFWAAVLNCLFCAYDLLDDKLDKQDFLLYSHFCIQFERIFSLFQLIKILNFMGISYNNLYEKTECSATARKYLYKEDTNVFAYYVIKNILLYHYTDFLDWCDKNNINTLRFDRYDNNLNKFFLFLEKKYKDPKFLVDIGNMQTFHFKTKKNGNYKNLLNTTRMTICEME